MFSLLDNLYPGRIDLGIGRAPGADMSTAVALAPDGKPRFEHFPAQTAQLEDFLWNADARPLVSPRPTCPIPLWMLGSSQDSAALAATRGLPYNLGLFINPQADPRLIGLYKKHYQPSEMNPEPHAILALAVFCAEDEKRAKELHLTYEINLFRFFTGQSDGRSLTPEQVADYPIGPREQAFIESRASARAVGTPEQVQDQLRTIARLHQADEIMAVTNMYYFEERKRSFELLQSLSL